MREIKVDERTFQQHATKLARSLPGNLLFHSSSVGRAIGC
nr:DUF3130 family protein [Listeria monocytogenes]